MIKKSKDEKQDDQELEDYLQADSELSKAYGAEEKAPPPAHLDKAILTAANDAVRTGQTAKFAYSPFARDWHVPASMVAVLVLSVGLVFTIYQDSGQNLLTAQKSEYIIDVQTAPAAVEDNAFNENNKRLKDVEEFLDEEDIAVDGMSQGNLPAPSSMESFGTGKQEGQQTSDSKILMRENATEMKDISPKKDASTQTMSDVPHMPNRRDESGHLETADVKKQKQSEFNDLNSQLGETKLRVIEQDKDLSPDEKSRYRQTLDVLQKQNESQEASPKKETIGEVEGLKRAVQSGKIAGDRTISPQQWLKQINDLWVAGDKQVAEESLKQFFEVYPDYPTATVSTILNQEIDITDYIK